jgi:hypothetical protein
MTKAARIFLAFAVIAVFSASLQAQDAEDKKSKKEQAGLRSIEGTVLDSSDQPATGAVVQLKDMRSLQVRSFIAQDGGLYHFTALKIDNDYQVKADFNGMTSGWRTLSVFDSRKVAVINLKTDKTEKK